MGKAGFTLVEVLVAMTVLLLIIAMLAQVVQNATSSIQRSTKGMDNNQLATIALDRIGNSIAGMITSGQGTLVAVKNSVGSDGLAMITNGRVRSRTSVSSISVSDFSNIRSGARGYCVITAADPDLSAMSNGAHPSVPMLNWGDGTVDWDISQTSTYVQADPLQALSLGLADMVKMMSGGTVSDAKMLQFDPLSRSIFRFEICFLLSDGSLLSTSNPPLNKHLISNGTAPIAPVTLNPTASGSLTLLPLAFNTQDSNYIPITVSNSSPPVTIPPLYVRAVIVGIASLDSATMKILTGDQLTKLGDISILAKTTDKQTPLQAWDMSDSTKTTYQNVSPSGSSKFPLPVLQNIRFTQRYFYVN